MNEVNIIFPHQLFLKSPLLENGNEIYLIEEFLFFKLYKFHKQKIAFHRASMKAYQSHLQSLNLTVHYIDSDNVLADIRLFSQEVKTKNIHTINLLEPTDDWLEQRVQLLSSLCKINTYTNPLFLNSKEDLAGFFRKEKKSFFQTTFYKQQRKKFRILMDEEQNPTGGKWTYDTENRKKYPKNKMPPAVHFPDRSKEWDEAIDYTVSRFSENPGSLSKERFYPISHKEASDWLEQFLTYRFYDFGIYEDAIVKESSILNHSILSPLMNVGLLQPTEIINRALTFSKEYGIPINSTEGFIRQIIGWREFIRGMYLCKGRFSRTRNFWGFDRKIPKSFYDGTTGIEPIDHTIKKVLQNGYCNHIERLMILGNFMLLCEFDPDEVYRWFMELFIDAYDWVMVPNVYGMCMFADGGTFATKPYIGGSNYIKKMSNYPKGEWEQVWDGMFWSFVIKHKEFFRTNPRTSMLLYSLNKMSIEKQEEHIKNANSFIKSKLEFQ
ncbi:cryptochrome/photolyase family protein [Bacteroidia bacterium]|nr:cryptochrome/photolyase family protein [Bacteroidia bacterium]MDB9881800.1 cryptochrome/photolyase family protein [Bacteroidia bacterium]MDC1395023.1 cryptochrome/photolyase family protein [Bacteroidia bacterium]